MPWSKIFEDLAGQKWSAITLQVSILAVSVYFLLRGDADYYFGLAAILVISLFCLQVVSRRFLIFYPVRTDFNVPTPRADTYILRSFIIFALYFLVLGVVWTELSSHWYPLLIITTLLLVVLPAAWMAFIEKLVKNSIAKQVRELPPTRIMAKCLFSKDDDPHPQFVTRELISADLVKTTIKCEECGYEHERIEPIVLGY